MKRLTRRRRVLVGRLKREDLAVLTADEALAPWYCGVWDTATSEFLSLSWHLSWRHAHREAKRVIDDGALVWESTNVLDEPIPYTLERVCEAGHVGPLPPADPNCYPADAVELVAEPTC